MVDGPAGKLVTISIHALRVEGDGDGFNPASLAVLFLSTPSVWRATPEQIEAVKQHPISIHALRVEGDSKSAQKTTALLHQNIQNLLLPAIYPAGAARK